MSTPTPDSPLRDAVTAAADAYAQDEAAKAAAAQQIIDQATIDTQAAQLAKDVALEASQSATIAQLSAELAALQPKVLIGASAGANSGETESAAAARVQKALGALQVVRLYDNAKGLLSVVQTAQTAGLAGKVPLVLSCKYSNPKAFAATIPAEFTQGVALATSLAKVGAEIYVAFDHEGDVKIVAGTYTAADWIAGFQAAASAVHAANNPALRTMQIWSGFQIGARFPGEYAGAAAVDAIGIDPYSHTAGDTALSVCGPDLDPIATAGKPLAITETGCTYTGQPVADYIATFPALFAKYPAIFAFCWFESSTYTIEGNPAAAAAFDALAR